jgi:hypothetical protein
MVATEPLPVDDVETAAVEAAPERVVPRRAGDQLFQLGGFALLVVLLVLSAVIWP